MTKDSLIHRAGAVDGARGERLQRVLADAGVAARRACEKMIEEGRVRVNGEIRRELPVFVDPATDRIEVDGRPIARESRRPVYVMLYKPGRVLTVGADEPGADRTTVTDLVKHHSGTRLYPVGRLSYDATGLVLMTNDGEMANRLTHPRYGVPRTYHALVKGSPDEATLANLEREMHKFQRIENRKAGRLRAGRVSMRVVGKAEGKTIVEIVVREGTNRQVEESLELAGFPVRKLMRVALGPLELKGVPEGGWRDLEKQEVTALRRAVSDRARPEDKEPRGRTDRPRGPRRAGRGGRTGGGARGPRRPRARSDRSSPH